MSKEQLIHIFEESACLTQRQMKGYVSGKMVHEEAHAAEVHLLSCPFCAEALEGILAEKDRGSLAAMEKLDAGFIAKHFNVPSQEIKQAVNKPPVIKAGAYSTQPEKKKETPAVRRLWKPMALAASLVAAVCIMWFMRDAIFPQDDAGQLAQQTVIEENKPEPEIAYQPLMDTVSIPAADTSVTVTETIQEDVEAVKAVTAMTPQEAAMAKKEADKKAADAKTLLMAEAAKKAAAKKDITSEKTPAIAADFSPAAPEQRTTAGSTGAVSTIESAADDKEKEAVAATAKKPRDNARTGIEKADDLYNKGKIRRALKAYQDEMYDTRSNKRDGATLMAAKCHIELGETTQAKTLLNSLVNDNSPKKGQAAQLLKELGE